MKAQKHILTLLIASTIALPLSAIAQTSDDQFRCLTADQIKDYPLIDTSAPTSSIHLKRLSTCRAGYYNSKGSEIVAYDPDTKRLFVVNMAASVSDKLSALDVIDIHDPSAPVRQFQIGLCNDLFEKPFDGKPIPTSVAVYDFQDPNLPSLVALAVTPPEKLENLANAPSSKVLFYYANMDTPLPSEQCPEPLRKLDVGGYGADMVTFTPDGKWVLVANSGSANLVGPNGSYNLPGSVSIINLAAGLENTTVTNVNFKDSLAPDVEIPSDVRIPSGNYAPTPVPLDWKAQSLKPEYIAVSPDSQTAWVTLEVNNAMAVVDIGSGKITNIRALGYKDHNLPANGLDASDQDDPNDPEKGIPNIQNWPVLGMYQPDAIVAYQVRNHTYLITANEGVYFKIDNNNDERIRVNKVELDPKIFLPPDYYKQNSNLGRLRVSGLKGTNSDGSFKELYTFGARSFSIWSGDDWREKPVFDSAADFERITEEALVMNNVKYFNLSDTDNYLDSRSDDNGPEPDGVDVGKVNNRYYAFTVLARPGGIMVYDITDPENEPPLFQQYINNRNLEINLDARDQNKNKICNSGNPDTVPCNAGDLGPEGVLFIAAQDSPNKISLLVVANPTSSSTTLYSICAHPNTTIDVPSNQVSISRGGFRYNRGTKRFVQVLTLTNTTSDTIQGPISLALDALSSNATLYNPESKTACLEPLGNPYIAVNVGADNVFSPGESATVVLEFDNPSKQGITYNTHLLAGVGNR